MSFTLPGEVVAFALIAWVVLMWALLWRVVVAPLVDKALRRWLKIDPGKESP